MEVWELLVDILKKSKNQSFLDVRIDVSVPRPFEEVYEIVNDKGMLLFREKKGEKKGEKKCKTSGISHLT